jgi:PAS domain S-box-containing protein
MGNNSSVLKSHTVKVYPVDSKKTASRRSSRETYSTNSSSQHADLHRQRTSFTAFLFGRTATLESIEAADSEVFKLNEADQALTKEENTCETNSNEPLRLDEERVFSPRLPAIEVSEIKIISGINEQVFPDDEILRKEFSEFFFNIPDYREKFQEILWQLILTKLPFKEVTESTFGDYHLVLGKYANHKIHFLTQLRTRDSQYFTGNSKPQRNSSKALISSDHEFMSFENCMDYLLLSVWLLFVEMKRKNRRNSSQFSLVHLFEPIEESVKMIKKRAALFRRTASMQVMVSQPSRAMQGTGSSSKSSPSKNKGTRASIGENTVPLNPALVSSTPSKSDYERFQAIMRLFDSSLSSYTTSAGFTSYVQSGQFLNKSINSIIDSSPVAMVISEVKKHRPIIPEGQEEKPHNSQQVTYSFPTVYVNNAFELLTQFSREDMLGKSCKRLQSEKVTEKSQADKIAFALQNGVGLKVVITNVKKDGTTFYNFLSFVPVYNRHGQYAYVIAKLYDITDSMASYRDVKMSEEVLYLTAMILRGC